MAVGPGHAYEYSALPCQDSIRLLRVRSRPGEPVRVSLEVYGLDDESVYYDCLSYTWGDPLYNGFSTRRISEESGKRTVPLSCDGSVMLVTENLHEALLQLGRNGYSSRKGGNQYQRQELIWIDAVCINQVDTPERNAQVAMMNRIYHKAQTVIVWLGINDMHTETALLVMDVLASVSTEKRKAEIPLDLEDEGLYAMLEIQYIEPSQWLDLGAFLRRTWFSRIWVVQEIFAARNIVVFCGHHVLSWADITAASQTLRETQLGRLLEEAVERAVDAYNNRSTATVYVGNTIVNQFIFQNLRENATSLNLEKLLTYSRYFDATNASDVVYAVLGIWHPPWVQTRFPNYIKPDYSMGVEAVYTLASVMTIREMGDLYLLSLVEDASIRKFKALPSWVPDYSVTPITEPLSGNPRAAAGAERWNASKGLKFEVPVQMSLFILPVHGILLGTIVDVAADRTDQHVMKSLLDLLSRALDRRPSTTSPTNDTNISTVFDSFYRTLIKDTFRSQPTSKSPLSAQSAFPLLITKHVLDIHLAISQLLDADPASKELRHLSNLYSETQLLISHLSAKEPAGTGIVPSWSTITRTMGAALENRLAPETDMAFDDISESFRVAYTGRRLFLTGGLSRSTGTNSSTTPPQPTTVQFGLGAQSLRVGDEVWVLAGVSVPVILRRVDVKEEEEEDEEEEKEREKEKEKEKKKEKRGRRRRRRFVSEAYIHGVMNGEGIEEHSATGRRKEVPIDLE